MSSHKRISQSSSIATTPASSTRRAPATYCVEERIRSVYVTSDVDPSKWNLRKLESLFPHSCDTVQPVQRTLSQTQTEYIITEASSNFMSQPRSAPAITTQRSRQSNPPSPLHHSPNRSIRPRILFYHKSDPYYSFTNFSPHPVKYKGKVYPTSEHLFQSFKFQGHRNDLAEHIRLYSSYPSVAFSEARRFTDHVRKDWRNVNIQMMDEAIYHKFIQHQDIRAELLATGEAELIENSDKDAFWGIGSDGKGSNELGKSLERLRARLRKDGW